MTSGNVYNARWCSSGQGPQRPTDYQLSTSGYGGQVLDNVSPAVITKISFPDQCICSNGHGRNEQSDVIIATLLLLVLLLLLLLLLVL